jgi:hypothetical protein
LALNRGSTMFMSYLSEYRLAPELADTHFV